MGARTLVCHVEALPNSLDAVDLYERTRGLAPAILLDSSGKGELGKSSIVALGPCVLSTHCDGNDGDPFLEVQRLHRRFRTSGAPGCPFAGGLVGYFSYDTRVALEQLPQRHPRETNLPDAYWIECRVFLLRDEATGKVSLGWLNDPRCKRTSEATKKLVALVRARLGEPEVRPEPFRNRDLEVAEPPRAQHIERVARARELIAAGDIYQVNLARRWIARRPKDGLELYRRLRSANPPTFGVYLETSGEVLMSVSPERFLKVTKKEVSTRPIKGTARRDPDPAKDQSLASALLVSEKDRAELAMIVDVLRNDLARVSVPGSVQVRKALTLETHPTVHHLVAEIESRMESKRGLVDLLRATLPGGSITGAPRIRAMEIIDELEDSRRGPYCGTSGYLGYDGRMDTNILIRTAFTGGDRLFVYGGGGIVFDSDPVLETDETEHKVRALLGVLGAR